MIHTPGKDAKIMPRGMGRWNGRCPFEDHGGSMNTVTYQNGKLISNIDAILIFVKTAPDDWVDIWAVPGQRVPVSFVCEISTFVSDLVDSAYMDAVGTAYSLPNLRIGRGTFGGVFYLDVSPAPASYRLGPSDVLDADIRQAILDAVALGALPQISSNTVYIALTPGEVLWQSGLTGTKAGGGGYHDQIRLSSTQGVPYCVIGASSVGTPAISHEIVEAITDSDLSGWVDRSQNPASEVADICFPRTITFHGNEVSMFYSPVQGRCVGPADDLLKKPGVKVLIVGGRSFCDGGITAGLQFFVSANVTFLGSPEQVASYLWHSSDAQIDNITSPTPTITAPAAPGPFDVDVGITTAHGCFAQSTHTFTVVSEEQSEWFKRLCELLKHIPRQTPVRANPLWDPLRDLITHPLSQEEINAIKSYVEGLNRLVVHLEIQTALEPAGRSSRT